MKKAGQMRWLWDIERRSVDKDTAEGDDKEDMRRKNEGEALCNRVLRFFEKRRAVSLSAA